VSALPTIGVYPPLAPAGVLRPRPLSPAFPLDRPGLTLTHLGRGAVWLALRALGLGRGSRLAMPAYHCGSEVEAARLAGVELLFYRVDASLRVDEDDLARVAGQADAAYLISHFGFPMAQAPPGVPVIEDAAHGLFSAGPDGPLGSRGDAAVFCPRKSLGVPDGGALLLNGGQPSAPRGRPDAAAMARSLAALAVGRAAMARLSPVRRIGAAALGRFSRADAATREGTLTETVIGEWDLEVTDMEAAAARPSRVTSTLLPKADAETIRSRRRRNYELLLGDLAELCPEPFRRLEPGVAPLYFPLLTERRTAVLKRLLEQGVRAVEVWPVSHPLLDRDRFAELAPVRQGLLALPVHQGLEPWHMEIVLEAARAALLSGPPKR
jgi:dTDP-4-amino-4,6-dideoxygalactose transaminase